MINTDKAWKKWGKIDPYYGVLSDDKYRKQNFNEDIKVEFFESGINHIDWVLDITKKYFGERQRFDTCLDFGCGVGRLVIPLAKFFRQVVGMDVSEAMLQEAEVNCNEKKISNKVLIKSDDDFLGHKNKFDLIHSHIVFQHIPAKRGMAIFAKLLDQLNDDGIVAIHVPYYRETTFLRKFACWLQKKIPYLSNLINPLRGRKITEPPVQMNYYNLNDLLKLLDDKGIRKVLTISLHDYDSRFVFVFGQKMT